MSAPVSGSQLDLEFRPASYWELDDPIQAIVADIKGEERRRRVLAALELGTPDDLPQAMLQPLLDKELRQLWGRIHPLFMGGEYLPDSLIGETTIARVSLMSTTGDVMELRARPVPAGIGYRIVDEHDTQFWMPFATSQDPLRAGELIRLLDESHGMCVHCGTGIVMPVLVMNFGRGPRKEDDVETWRRQASAFARVESRFYPELEQWYARRINSWLDSVLSAFGRMDASGVSNPK